MNSAIPVQPLHTARRTVPWGGGWAARLAALPVFAACVALLAVAAWLEPAAEGVGTHTQLGLAPCSFLLKTHIPCAACGMTTAFALAADGRLGRSFVTQPAGAALAVLTAVAALVSGYALLTGLPLAPVGRWLWRPAVLAFAGGGVVAAWIYKIIVMTMTGTPL